MPCIAIQFQISQSQSQSKSKKRFFILKEFFNLTKKSFLSLKWNKRKFGRFDIFAGSRWHINKGAAAKKPFVSFVTKAQLSVFCRFSLRIFEKNQNNIWFLNFNGFCILVWGKSSILKSDWKTYDGGDTVGSECTGSGKPLQEVGAIRGLRPPINLHQPTVQCNPPINEHPPPWDYTAICSPLATCVVVDFEKFFWGPLFGIL